LFLVSVHGSHVSGSDLCPLYPERGQFLWVSVALAVHRSASRSAGLVSPVVQVAYLFLKPHFFFH
jgi:hypothetical protein